jgi:PadR family transcriptional regulator PadR
MGDQMPEKQQTNGLDLHQNSEKFMEACLLMLLREESCYGYLLLEKLPAFGFAIEHLNTATIYKILRKMETNHWVNSIWESGKIGPNRRIYTISDTGIMELDHRFCTMQTRIIKINHFISRYNDYVKKDSKDSESRAL